MSNHRCVHALDPVSRHDVRVKVGKDKRVIGPYFLHMTEKVESSSGSENIVFNCVSIAFSVKEIKQGRRLNSVY